MEGNNANLYTTDAMATNEYAFHLIPQMQKPTKTLAGKLAKVRQPGIEPGSIAWKATMLTFTPPTLCVFHDYFRTKVWKKADYTP